MRFCPTCHGRYDDASRFCPHDGQPLPADAEDGRIGTVLLGQFELLEVCGKGAMGTVYRAWQTGMERQVAIKVLRPELLRDPKTVLRFDREARAVAKLQHPNIVTFLLVGETPDRLPFLAMEYVDGQSLADVLAEQPVLDTARTLHVAHQVCSALADAHAEGIIHRDLKPANLLLTQRRRMPDFVKVLDFGIAKVLRGEVDSAGELESRLTRTGTIFGTPHYIAPEQAAGSDVDGRADLYSLGVILYRCLTGRLPFEGLGINVMLAHMGQPVPAPRAVKPDLDPALEELILRALEKDPASRYQTAEELADALEALGARRPEASSPSPVLALRAGTGRTAAARGAGLELAAAPEPAWVASAAERPSASVPVAAAALASAPPEDRAARRRGAGWIAAGLALGAFGAAAGAVYLSGSRRGVGASLVVHDARPALSAIVADAAVHVVGAPPDAPSAAQAEPDVRPGYRVVTVGESGYAVRAQVPEDPRVGPSYEIVFDVIDPDGSTTDDPTLPATIEEPGALRRTLSIPQIGTSGRYVLRRSFTSAGRYHVHLYPIPDRQVHIWFDFVVRDAGRPSAEGPPGKAGRPRPGASPGAVSAGASADAGTASPTGPGLPPILGNLGRRPPGTEPPAPPAGEPPQPVPPAGEPPEPAAPPASPARPGDATVDGEAPTGGVGDSDPYHLIEDRTVADGGVQPPSRPGRHGKRARPPTRPNPDGRE